jgi:hypothetical protein
MADNDDDAWLKKFAAKGGAPAGDTDAGAGAAGMEHSANRFFFGMLPKLMEGASKYGVEDMGMGKLPEGLTAQAAQEHLDASKAAHPTAVAVGEGVADIAHQAALAPIMPFAGAGGLGGAVVSNALTSGTDELAQNLAAYGRGEKTIGEAAWDTGKGALTGAAGGAIGHGLTRAIPGRIGAEAKIGTLQGPLGGGLSEAEQQTFGKGAAALREAGVAPTPGAGMEVGGMLSKNPAIPGGGAGGEAIDLGQKIAKQAEEMAASRGQTPMLGRAQQEAQDALAARQSVLANRTAAAEATAAPAAAEPIRGVSNIGGLTNETHKTLKPLVPEGVGKDSPLAFGTTRADLGAQAASTLDPVMKTALGENIGKLDTMIGKKVPAEAAAQAARDAEAAAGQLGDVVNRPIAAASSKADTKISDLTLGDLGGMAKAGFKKAAGSLGSGGAAAGAAHLLGLPTCASAAIGAVPVVAKALQFAGEKLGSKEALKLYLQNPEKFLAQYGKATALRAPAGVLGTQAAGVGAVGLGNALQNL